ncbi:MAG: transporter substrate-binding domain-containing protein [Pseudomonas sp.]|nr:transporter substrate-binding domain-containing protein [Pseudomonas sp.]
MFATAHAGQQACTTLMAVVHSHAEPYDWQAPDTGAQHGLSVDFLQALAKQTQLTIKNIATKNTEKALREVRSGRVDLIIGVHNQPEQDARLDYLYPAYAQQNYSIWLRAGEQVSLKQWPQLSGLRGVRALDSKKLPDFDTQVQLLAWPMRSVQDNKTATQEVLQGQADYLIAEQNRQQLYLQEGNLSDFFEVIEPPVATHQLFVALSKDSACNDLDMRNKLSKALLELTKSALAQNRLNAVMQQWQTLHSGDSSIKSE